MNSRQRKKRSKKLNFIIFEEAEIKGRNIYSYTVVHNNIITIGFTARPKQNDVVYFHKNTSLKNLVYTATKRPMN